MFTCPKLSIHLLVSLALLQDRAFPLFCVPTSLRSNYSRRVEARRSKINCLARADVRIRIRKDVVRVNVGETRLRAVIRVRTPQAQLSTSSAYFTGCHPSVKIHYVLPRAVCHRPRRVDSYAI
jgi:hypothetical protein